MPKRLLADVNRSSMIRPLLVFAVCFSVCSAGLSTALSGQSSRQSTPQKTRRQHLAIPGSPSVDGRIDEAWKNAPVTRTTRPVAELTTLSSDDSSLAIIRCLWDQEHIYVLAQVTDNNLQAASGAPWEQDSFEILLDENLGRSESYQNDDVQFRINCHGIVSVGQADKRELIESAVKTVDNGYVVEAKIKLSTITARENLRLGIEFQVNNDAGTGKRSSVLKWNDPSDESWRNTSRFGTLVLGSAQQAADWHEPPEEMNWSTSDATETSQPAGSGPLTLKQRVPDWARDAVFYQLFPERFCNGDPTNDPTRESLEFPDIVPRNWRITPWTSQWYARDQWERQMGPDFYENGVFHRRYGGDLQGVIDKLDYLSALGINVIYFNPVFYARSLHKYDGNSFHHIDPHFGPDPAGDLQLIQSENADPATWNWTAADKLFLELLRQAHQKNIRVIIDGVFNHTGRDFFAFADIQQRQKDSPYVDWYHVEKFDDPTTPANEFKYRCWWGVDTLPEFADNADATDLHPKPKAYVMQATRRWMDPNADGDPVDGIDGWRLDVANEVPNQFWRDWNRMVRQLNPAAYTVAEIWDDAGNYLDDCGFSATMNYHGFAFPSKGFLIDARISGDAFVDMLQRRMQNHAPAVRYALQNLIDSHDTDRLASMIVNAGTDREYLKPERFDYDVGQRVSPRWFPEYDTGAPTAAHRRIQKLLAVFQMSFVGAPMIYYGTEAGMDGADDPDDRMPMVWDDLNFERRTLNAKGEKTNESPIRFDQDLLDFYRNLIHTRHQNVALRRGGIQFVTSSKNAVGFVRSHAEQDLLVLINRGQTVASLSIDLTRWTNNQQYRLVPVFDSGPVELQSLSFNQASATIQVKPLSGQIWKIEH